MLVILLPAPAAAAAGGDAPAAATLGPSIQAQTTPAVDNTGTDIRVGANGSADWIVRVRTRLDSESAVAAFERFQSEFRANTSRFLDPFRARMERTVREAANVTNRSMSVQNFTATTRIQTLPRRWGVVAYRFEWVGFARPNGSTLIVGDVFQGGFHLTDRDLLTVRAPTGYGIADVAPPGTRENGTVTWTGPADFASERPRVRFVANGSEGGTGGSMPSPDAPDRSQTPETPTRPSPEEERGLPVVPLLGGALIAVAVATGLGGYVTVRPPTEGEPAVATTEPATSPVLTDEERVRQLLAERGRMRQGEVADEFDWSSSKTSRVLSRMADEGEIEKIRIGRENLIRLPDAGD